MRQKSNFSAVPFQAKLWPTNGADAPGKPALAKIDVRKMHLPDPECPRSFYWSVNASRMGRWNQWEFNSPFDARQNELSAPGSVNHSLGTFGQRNKALQYNNAVLYASRIFMF
ncbi:MAG: hypothetical protein R3C56_20875 [Pirellulaceae bacterium]